MIDILQCRYFATGMSKKGKMSFRKYRFSFFRDFPAHFWRHFLSLSERKTIFKINFYVRKFACNQASILAGAVVGDLRSPKSMNLEKC